MQVESQSTRFQVSTFLYRSQSDMTIPSISQQARRLNTAEIEQFHELGFVKSLPLLDENGIKTLQADFMKMVESTPKEVDIYRVNNWHKANRWFYELTRTPAILDYVEDLLGPDFFHWGGSFFIKFPHDETVVPWHQDAKYWPLEPRTTVTVWLAVFDSDTDNGCMRVIPGSHRWGDLHHNDLAEAKNWEKQDTHQNSSAAEKSNYVLWQKVDSKAFDEETAVDLTMQAGELSLHDDDLIHGSPGNKSDRLRAGITLRYSPTNVKCDLSVWPNFEAYPSRGVDQFQHNPVGQVPNQHGYPLIFNQNSSEFE